LILTAATTQAIKRTTTPAPASIAPIKAIARPSKSISKPPAGKRSGKHLSKSTIKGKLKKSEA